MENFIVEIKVTNEKGKSDTVSFPYDVYVGMKENNNINMVDDLLSGLIEKLKQKDKK
jgi:hypothetical protein